MDYTELQIKKSYINQGSENIIDINEVWGIFRRQFLNYY